jgi:hypothetical protein
MTSFSQFERTIQNSQDTGGTKWRAGAVPVQINNLA